MRALMDIHHQSLRRRVEQACCSAIFTLLHVSDSMQRFYHPVNYHPQRADQHTALKASMRDPSLMISRANRRPREPDFVGRKPSMHTHIDHPASTREPGHSCYLRRRGLGECCGSTSLQPTTMPYVYLHVLYLMYVDVLPCLFAC